ncbi:MAG: InlB B-repeat-containing protein [Firmicutes bacterium]|nr:InlB B-repeat-containing protein [Bacillota bacterium]
MKKVTLISCFIVALLLMTMVFFACNFSNDYSDYRIKPEEYTVTFDLNGGIGNNFDKVFIASQPFGAVSAPERDGKLFIGWAFQPESEYILSIKHSFFMDATVYAQWGEINAINTIKSIAYKTASEMRGFSIEEQYSAFLEKTIAVTASGVPIQSYWGSYYKSDNYLSEVWYINGFVFNSYTGGADDLRTGTKLKSEVPDSFAYGDLINVITATCDNIEKTDDGFVFDVKISEPQYRLSENSYTPAFWIPYADVYYTVKAKVKDGKFSEIKLQSTGYTTNYWDGDGEGGGVWKKTELTPFSANTKTIYYYGQVNTNIPVLPKIKWTELFDLTIAFRTKGTTVGTTVLRFSDADNVLDYLQNYASVYGMYTVEGFFLDPHFKIKIPKHLVIKRDTTVYAKLV